MSNPETRSIHYGNCGRILAGTANNLGYPVDDSMTESWGDTLSKLASADDLSEADPEAMDAPELLAFLDLDPNNPRLINSAANLISGNQHSLLAGTLREHFNGRILEALSVLDLLRHQSGEQISTAEDLWERLGSITVVSSHLDAFTDAREDAPLMPQFTSGQLACGALTRMVTSATRVKPGTTFAFLRAIGDFPDTGSLILDRIRDASLGRQAA